MTEEELTLIHDKNLIKLQELEIRELYRPNKRINLVLSKQDKEINRTKVKTIRQAIRVLKSNYKKDLEKCCEDIPIEVSTQQEDDF